MTEPAGKAAGWVRVPAASDARAAPGLSTADFQAMATRGFGDGRNAYAHSMLWFMDHLYVGTTRDNLCLVAARNPLAMKCWPVRCEEPPDPQGLRAQIWRHRPSADAWERVYLAPMIVRDGQEVMRDIGYRGMAAFQGSSDPGPALYVGTWSATGVRVLRSLDGRRFAEVGDPGLGYPGIVCLRTLLPFKGRLFTSPVGRSGRGPNEAELPAVLETADPVSGQWRVVSPPGFGDPRNVGVFELQAFNGYLYAATINYTNGFELWKTSAEGRPPYEWEKVLSCGAYRGLDNETGLSLCEFGGALYLGTGITGGGYNRYQRIGPAAAEVLRIHADDQWELLVGTPRITPDGLKAPLSGMGPGFNNFFNGYVWRMGVHQGWLYASTYNWAVFLPYLTLEGFPEAFREEVRRRGVSTLVDEFGGAELWRTRDGVRWYPVTRDGFGSPFNFGFRTLASTPHGLYVGTANPFGPVVAEETARGWVYRPNARGGCEVWRGRVRDGLSVPANSGREGARRVGERAALRMIYRRCAREAYARLTDEYYGHSGFDQMGYWGAGARSGREACDHLMDRLVALAGNDVGRILDVECERGGTTRYLVKRFKPAQVTAVGCWHREWHALAREAPGVTLREMDPTALDLEDGQFDTVICVERASSFRDRLAFLREAFRVLAPGGRIVLADTLYSRVGEAADWSRNRRNFVRDAAGYRALLLKCGFREAEVIDATGECADVYREDISRAFMGRYRAGHIDSEAFNWIMGWIGRTTQLLTTYLLAVARKA